MTWKTEPMVTSEALMGVPLGSRVSRFPFPSQRGPIVCASSSRVGGRGRRRPKGGSGESTSAPSRVLRIRGRRLKPVSF